MCWVMTACQSQPELEQFMPIMVNSDTNTNSTGRILIVSHYTMDGDYLKYTLHNHRSYAKKHGYDYWFRNGKIDGGKYSDPQGKNRIFELGLYWQKIEAVQQALALKDASGKPRYDWVMWIDADAFFTNQQEKIENVLDGAGSDTFMAISQDFPGGTCVNTGVWLIKNTQEGRSLIDLVTQTFPSYKNQQYPEQMAVGDVVFSYVSKQQIEENSVQPYERRGCDPSRIISGVKVLPQRALNAYYTSYAMGIQSAAWQPGDYIAHVAGSVEKLDLIKKLVACMREKAPNLHGCSVEDVSRGF